MRRSHVYAANDRKRPHVPSWDEVFMNVAASIATRSKDPKTQVGACIVDSLHRVVAIGYNGFPRGCCDDTFPWRDRAARAMHTKYMYVVHAELNAILNSKHSVRGGTLYTTRFPCNECTKALIQAGIRKVLFRDMKHIHSDSVLASIRMLAAARVECLRIASGDGTL